VLEPDAMDIEVAAVHQAFVQGLRARGGEIRRSSPVIGLSGRGETWVVTTPWANRRA
jgi:D-arginine dehydrogenase